MHSFKWLACVFFTVILASCGGGSDGAPPANGGGAGSSPPPGNTTTGVVFKLLPRAEDSADSFLALVNAQGADGFRYVDDFAGVNNTPQSLFIRDGLAPTYSYQLLPTTSTVQDLLQQADAEGANGYRYVGPTMLGGAPLTLYRNDGGTSATYVYLAKAPASSPDAFVSEANSEGALGLWYVGPISVGGTQQDLFMGDAAATRTYGFQQLPAVTNQTDFMNQLDAQGAQGYRYKGQIALGGTAVNLYVKDLSESATFAYQAEPTPIPADANALVKQANALNLNYFGLLSADGANFEELYFSSDNCAGFLCKTLESLTQN